MGFKQQIQIKESNTLASTCVPKKNQNYLQPIQNTEAFIQRWIKIHEVEQRVKVYSV